MSTAMIRPSATCGKIEAPPSKSMAHRALICAALADGKSTISNITLSEDISATAGALRALGAEISFDEKSGTAVVLPGRPSWPVRIDCHASGSTLRFMIPLCLLSGGESILSGSGRLMERPLDVYENVFREKGILFSKTGDGIRMRGKLVPGEYSVRGDISSQFITGLLLALPMLDGPSRVIVRGKLNSAPYIGLTRQMQRVFGVNVRESISREEGNGREAERVYSVDPAGRYAHADAAVEGDWTNAAYLDVFGLAGGSVSVSGLEEESLQGDRIYREYFERIAAGASDTACGAGRVLPRLNISACPDLGPVLIAAAMLKHGAVLTGTSRLALKESDRGHAMAEEAEKFGVRITVNEDSIIVPDSALKRPERSLSGHNDHRIVMALAALASVTGGTITGAEAVKKSFPDFFGKIRKAGIDVSIKDQ